jgi:hypothetical protein
MGIREPCVRAASVRGDKEDTAVDLVTVSS